MAAVVQPSPPAWPAADWRTTGVAISHTEPAAPTVCNTRNTQFNLKSTIPTTDKT